MSYVSQLRAFGLLTSLLLPTAAQAITVEAVNATSFSDSGGRRTYYFATTGTSKCAFANQRTFPVNLSRLNPSTTDTGPLFNVTATKDLTVINNNSSPVSTTDISIRVEITAPTNTNDGVALLSQGNGYNDGLTTDTTGAFYVAYSNVANTPRTVGIALADNPTRPNGTATVANGFCDQLNTAFGGATTDSCSTKEDTPFRTITVRFGVVKTGNKFTDSNADLSDPINLVFWSCPPTQTVNDVVGISTTFDITNGDSQVKINNGTARPASLIPLTKAVVFAAPASTVTGDAPIKEGFNDVGGGTYTVTGLANEQPYCFSVGYVNAAGFLSTGTDWANSTMPTIHCATPSKIEGFLDRSTCFIASAAYGDEWDPRLETLRQFRDQILSQTHAGRAFIDWYYEWSPQAARWLFENPAYRLTVQALLLPLVEGARLALFLRNNMWIFGAMLLLGTALLATVRVRASAE